MGLLSDFGDSMPNWLPDDPAKKDAMRAGLMQFGAALMGGKGNFGSILGDGIGAGSKGYAGAMEAQQKQALQAAQMGHHALQTKKMQAEIDEPMELAKIAALVRNPGPARQQFGVSPVAALPQIGAEPKKLASIVVPPEPLLQNAAPSGDAPLSPAPQAVIPSAPQPVAPEPQAQKAPQAAQNGHEYYMQLSQAYSDAGRPAAAKQYLEIAEKMRPKVKETRVITDASGKRVLANMFEDGRAPEVVNGFGPDAEKLAFGSTGGSYEGRDAYTGKVVSSTPMTQSPDSVASGKIQVRGQNMTDARAKATADSGDQAPITDAAILNAAARYNLDGTLPPMGMGKNAAAGRSAILNKAADLASGIDPTEQRKNQIGAKNELASQGAAVKAFTSGKQGNSVRSFNVSLSHLDTLDQLTDALHNRDTKMINKVGNYFAEQTGSTAPTNFDAAKKIVADEIVKAIVGSGGGVHDREEAARVISAANSPAQLKGVIGTYKELMRGQLHGLQQQYEVSTGKKDFDKFLSPHAKTASKPIAVGDLPKKPVAPATAKFLGFE